MKNAMNTKMKSLLLGTLGVAFGLSAAVPSQAQLAPGNAPVEPGFITNEPTGQFVLSGNPSPVQYHNTAILVRCKADTLLDGSKVPVQRSCDPAQSVQVPMNQAAQLPAGDYILAFENTVYPGLISIRAGQTREIKLIPLQIPLTKEITSATRITVSRDLSRLEEQKKIYFSEFTMAQPLFPLTVPDGYEKDLYPRMGDADKPILQDGRYKVCDSKKLPPLSPKAKRLCRLWRMQNPMALSEFFNFGEDATFEQYMFIRPRGPINSGGAVDVMSKKRGRLLITPNNLVAGNFVNVLPGAYRIDFKAKNGVAKKEQYIVGYQPGTFSLADLNAVIDSTMGSILDGQTFGSKFRTSSLDEVADAVNSSDDDPSDDDAPKGKSCSDYGVVYKTELRSYCVNDPSKPAAEGCDQNQTSYCELIPVIK